MSKLSTTSEAGGGFEFPFTQADFQTIAGIVYKQSGIVLGAHKRDMTYARLTRRLRVLGLTSFKEYCSLLNSGQGEGEGVYLINAITTNLTKFFREPHHFEHLERQALPEIVRAAHGQKPQIKVWSAGCSSGEEPYSIAMTAMASRDRICRDWDFRILATDLDTSMLQKAKAGLYPRDVLPDIPERMRTRYFDERTTSSSGLHVSKAVQDLIAFRQLNLLGPWPMSGQFDLIFCRNVMIYFDAPTKTNLVARFHTLLKEGCWLYVGHSESLLDHQSRFKLCGRTIYQKVSS